MYVAVALVDHFDLPTNRALIVTVYAYASKALVEAAKSTVVGEEEVDLMRFDVVDAGEYVT